MRHLHVDSQYFKGSDICVSEETALQSKLMSSLAKIIKLPILDNRNASTNSILVDNTIFIAV